MAAKKDIKNGSASKTVSEKRRKQLQAQKLREEKRQKMLILYATARLTIHTA